MPTAVRWLPHGLGYFCNLAFTAALFINILGCIWYYTARVEGIRPGHTWLAIVGAPQAGDTAFINTVHQHHSSISLIKFRGRMWYHTAFR